MAVFLPFLSSSRYLSFVVPVSALGESPTSSHWHVCTLTANLTSAKLAVIGGFPHSFLRAAEAYFGYWGMFQVIALCGFIPGLWYLRRLVWGSNSILSWNTKAKLSPAVATSGGEAAYTEGNDPGLLKKHSGFKSYTTSRFTYPSLRIFFRRHPQADKLPTSPAPLPLLVFIHGLGGSVAQFHPLLTSLVNLASCLAIDLPGSGLSCFDPTEWDAYKVDALVELLATIIEDYREKNAGQGVVLIGHSMGCSLSVLLASRTSGFSTSLAEHIVGLVAVCPRAEPPTQKQVAKLQNLLMIPGPIFDLWRRWDRRGGINSPSVSRFAGKDADIETKKLQLRFNSQSRTPVWRRMASGCLPTYKGCVPYGGLPGRDVWAGLEVPVFLVAGESDNKTSPAEVEKIAAFLGKSHPTQTGTNEDSGLVAASLAVSVSADGDQAQGEGRRQVDTLQVEDFVKQLSTDNEALHGEPITPQEEISDVPHQSVKPKKVLKTTVLPAPASHALLYMPSTVRILAGLISGFLCSHVSPRLSLGWQLQFLSTAGKWDVKNLAKWQAVCPVSEPIAGIFRAMKTLREVDDIHCPEVFVKMWGSQIKDIIDISHDSPVYDPRGLERGGIRYHKLPTVSKIPPTGSEVREFIALVDRLREEQKAGATAEYLGPEYHIGVHCHYGFNRTGYSIVCYLVERCGYSVQGALDEFARKRPQGIKHEHFMDHLFVQYCVGLKRAPAM